MGQHCCLCIPILAAILSTVGALDNLMNANHALLDINLMHRPRHSVQNFKETGQKRYGSQPSLLPSGSDQSHSLPAKLDTLNTEKRLTRKTNVRGSTERGLSNGSQIIENHSSRVQLINSMLEFVSRDTAVRNNTLSTLSAERLSSTIIGDTVKLKLGKFVKNRAAGHLINDAGLGITSLDSGFKKNNKEGVRAMKINEEDLPVLERRLKDKPRFISGVRREKRDSFWVAKRSSFLSNSGTQPGDKIVYSNVEKWLDPLSEDEREMRGLLSDPRDRDSNIAHNEGNYKMNHKDQTAMSSERRSSEEIQESVGVVVKDLQKMDKAFLQKLEAGKYYYNVMDRGFVDLSKRDASFKDRIYALIKQGSRPTQRGSLQETTRGNSASRLHDKMERSQHSKRPPLKSLASKVTEGGTCDPDKDGTAPMRCPSSKDKCLYDDMICDGTPDCPQAEDEAFALCVLRHWTLKLFRKLHPET